MGRLGSSLRTLASTLFRVDLRALAALRIALASLLALDLASRARLLAVNYTDAGALPRAVALAYAREGELPSLYLLDGSAPFAAVLFVLTALAALALGLGWRTRLATCAAWLLVHALHGRNTLILDGGDHLLRALLFWCAFLPLGARFSLDARRLGPPAAAHVTSVASAGLLLQAGLVFLVTGLAKNGPEWFDGTAILYALDRRWWVQPFGTWLLAHAEWARLLTPAVRLWEIWGALLLFVPVLTGPLRVFAVLGFWGLLAGLALGLELNLFPWITGSALLPFLPSWAWDALGRRVPALRAGPVREPGGPTPRRPLAALAQLGLAALVALMLWTSAGVVEPALEPPAPLRRITTGLAMKQGWKMYAPSPRHVDAWFEHRGKLADRTGVDLDRAEGGVGWRAVRRAWQDYRFKYGLQKHASRRYADASDAYAAWLCRAWNEGRAEPERLASLSVLLVIEPIALPGERPEPRKYRPLASAVCMP